MSNMFATIFIHGLGDQGASWSMLRHELPLNPGLNIKWYFPDAPEAPVSCNNGYAMPSWFDLEEIPVVLDSPDAESDIIDSANSILKLVNRINDEVGIPPENIVVGGFSQGAVVALMTSLLSPSPFRGVVMLSGWSPMRNKLAEMKKFGDTAVPMFIGHGESDGTVTYLLGKESAPLLASIGYDVTFKSYPGVQHSTCSREMRDLGDWFNIVFK